MAKRTKDLGSALGALIAPDTPAPMAEEATRSAPVAADTGAPVGEGYARTSTGYRRDDGETVRRVSLFLTERQRRDLRRQAVDADAENVTEYVVDVLSLGRPRKGP